MMKKIISKIILAPILLLGGVIFVMANYQVIVTAIVGNLNHAPVIKVISPSDDPRLLKTSKIQNYSIYFTDNEKNDSTFTITSSNGYVYPVSGAVTNFDTSSGAYINFTYSSPSLIPTGNLSQITLTINDGSGGNIETKNLNLYIY